jgi:predicted histidine transporter YuiF (NhaC family)
MLSQVILAAIAQPGAGSSISSVTVYYILGSVATVFGVAGGLMKYYGKQRERWTQEGQQRAEQAAAVRHNSDKLDENTHAVFSLTAELREFVTSVRTELNGHENRIGILERFREDMRKGGKGADT